MILATRVRSLRSRRAFTLVEMLVALALIIFIMTILSEAFVQGLETFRILKAVGDMNERLRTTTTALRRDLNANHFEGRRRMSDPDFFFQGPPQLGFFRLYQGVGSTLEGVDATNIPSYRASAFASPPPPAPWTTWPTGAHCLHFAVRLSGKGRDNFFSTPIPLGSPMLAVSTVPGMTPAEGLEATYNDNQAAYCSPWTEVAYFLYRDPVTGPSAGTTPLYTLFRAQYIVVPDTTNLNWSPTPAVPGIPIPGDTPQRYVPYSGLSCYLPPPGPNQTIFFNNPADLTTPGNRSFDPNVGSAAYTAMFSTNSPTFMRGATAILPDVISFDVRALRYFPSPNVPDTDFVDLLDANALLGAAPFPNATYPFDFDTAGNTLLSSVCVLRGLQITIRVWDQRSQQARQVTLLQEL